MTELDNQLPIDFPTDRGRAFGTQLLKWVGNKQRMAPEIISFFPERWNVYHEPFLGSGGVLGTLAPDRGLAGDALAPLAEIWQMLRNCPDALIESYSYYRNKIDSDASKLEVYSQALNDFNRNPSGRQLVFLCRACYGGIVRFRMRDGGMSTPCGAHMPVSSDSFAKRVAAWAPRVSGTEFFHSDFRESFQNVKSGDVVYCDPPYTDSQKILYGAQSFSLHELIECVEMAKSRGAKILMSIDGSKKTGLHQVLHDFPEGLFVREAGITVGRAMLRRFQRGGETLEDDVVRDRLLLTY